MARKLKQEDPNTGIYQLFSLLVFGAILASFFGGAGWTTFGIVVGAVVLVLVLMAVSENQRHETLKLAVAGVVKQHAVALRRVRLQNITYDPYGKLVQGRWINEIEYFASTVVFPEVQSYVEARDDLPALVGSAIEAELGPFEGNGPSTEMSPLDFEANCAQAARDCGWHATTTKGSGDQGVDVIAEKDGVRVVFQCKLYSKPVGNAAVQEISAGKLFEGAQFAAVVSNIGYTPAARQLAATNDVALLHATDIQSYLADIAARSHYA